MAASTQAIKGGIRLTFDAVEGITNSVERMHETIARTPLPCSTQPAAATGAHGVIAAGVYAIIRGVNGGLREGVDRSLELLPNTGVDRRSETEIKTIAALNGAFGDHLEATGNTLATPMGLTTPDHQVHLNSPALATGFPQASPHLVVLVHGLGLSDRNWRRGNQPGMGEKLQENLGYTPLYLRFNSGRHISTNGREFAQLLDQLCAAWPVPVESLSLIGHSMGGLVIRSACWYGHQAQASWLQPLQRVVCLGTPHHGSPVAKAGHALNRMMEKSPYTAPLAFGKKRSAGIKDLRHGYLLDEDWQSDGTGQPLPERRRTVPLLPNVDYYFAAATVGRDSQDPLGHLLGDLLVRLDSAVGSHRDDLRQLAIKPENCRVFHNKNHFDLLHDESVHRQIIDWFSASQCDQVTDGAR